MNKGKIYDEMLLKINFVLGGKLLPEDFAEELSGSIASLQAQVNSLSEMLEKQEAKEDRVMTLLDRVIKLVDKELMLINNQMVLDNTIKKELERQASVKNIPLNERSDFHGCKAED